MDTELADGLLRPHAMQEQIFCFAAAMVESNGFPDAAILLAFLKKPWKWAPEYAAWVNSGEPQSGDDDEWPTWLDALAAVQIA